MMNVKKRDDGKLKGSATACGCCETGAALECESYRRKKKNTARES